MPEQAATTAGVRAHYDRLSVFYRRLWGEHIHHGFWENGESPAEAQLNLTRRLAEVAEVPIGARVLDVGCGLGASSLWLARERDCTVVGITISPKQRRMAEQKAHKTNLSKRVRFEVRDANALDFGPASFDVVWVIECSEHLVDKGALIQSCARVLRPGGVLGLCAWLSAEAGSTCANPHLVDEVCRAMHCPSLGSMSDYRDWIASAGFEDVTADNITRQVERTWEICERAVRRPWVQMLLPLMRRQTREFAASFGAIRRAFAENAMAYGMFSAKKP